MANERLYQFPAKASPVPADLIYGADSANSNNEVNITIAALIAAYPNLSGIAGLTLGANTYPYSNASSVLTAGSISPLAVTLLADTTISTMQSTLGYQSAPAASLFAGWDANKNLSANSFISGYATTATAAGTTTLVVGSAFQQFFTGVTTQTVLLPVTSTLALGQSFYIVNNSSGNVTVQSSGGNNIQVMGANTTLLVTCILTSGTTAASWYADYNFQNALTLPLSLAQGGTNAALTASNGGIFYSTASAGAILAGTATANLPLLSGSTAAPTWGAFVLSLGGALTTGGAHTLSGAFASTFTFTGTTSLTFPTSGTVAALDANSNLSANNHLSAYATTATAGSSTTLTVASAFNQFFTGSLTQTVVMPVTSTLVLGQSFYIVNNSSGVVTVNSSGGNTIIAMAASTTALLTCVLTSGTTAASWFAEYEQSDLVLPLSLTNGGTNAALTANNGGILWSNASALAILSGTATAGLALLSGATGAPTWSNNAPITKVNVQVITSTGTYTPTTGTKFGIAFIWGAGGGSTGSGTTAGTAAGAGGTTSLGAIASASGGAAGSINTTPSNAAGGTGTGGTLNLTGSNAQIGGNVTGSSANGVGPIGGSAPMMGIFGAGTLWTTASIAPPANTGAGAGASGGGTTAVAGNAGGGGGLAIYLWPNPTSQTVTIGAGGTAGGAGGAGNAGSVGSKGLFMIIEFIST